MALLPAPRRPRTDREKRGSEPRARARAYAPAHWGSEIGLTGLVGERGSFKRRAVAWLLFAAWRWRRQHAPMVAVAVLVVSAAIGHAASAGLAWAPATFGLAVAGAIVLFGHRPIHRRYAAIVAATGAWLALAWWVGLANRLVLGALAVLAAVSSAVWLAHHLPRSRIEVRGGSRNPLEWGRWRFRQFHKAHLRTVLRDWPTIAGAAKVPNVHVRKAIADSRETENVYVLDHAGYSLVDLEGRALERIATGLRAPRMSVRIEADAEFEHVARLYVARVDPPGFQPPTDGEEDREEPGDDGVIVGFTRTPARDRTRARNGKVAERTNRLRAAAAELGDRAVTAHELAKIAGLPAGWVNPWLERLAGEIGLEAVDGGRWRRAGEDTGR